MTVHAAGGRVAVHCTGQEAVGAAVAAGADSIEPGWAVTDSHFAVMRERGTAWVPTLFPGGSDAACEFAAAMGFAGQTLAWMRLVLDAQRQQAVGHYGILRARRGPVSRDRLIALLFQDAGDPAAALRWNLGQVRRLLGPPEPCSAGCSA